MASALTDVPGGGDVAGGADALAAAADALTIPEGWFVTPTALPNVPILLSTVPFVDNVKDVFVDKDPSDMSPECILNRSNIDTVRNLIGEEKMNEMVNDAASIGQMNKLVEKCFCLGAFLPLCCAPCFCCIHSLAQSKPRTYFDKWREHVKTVPKVSADYNFELHFRPGNIWAAIFAGTTLPYQFFHGFAFRPTDDAYQKILAEEATRKAQEALGIKSDPDNGGESVTQGADVEKKESEDHWLVSALGLGSSNAATTEETPAATATDGAEGGAQPAEPDVTVTENGNNCNTNDNTEANNVAGEATEAQNQQDATASVTSPAAGGGAQAEVNAAQPTPPESTKKKSWFGRSKKEENTSASRAPMIASSGGGEEVVQPDAPAPAAAEPPAKKSSWFGSKKKDKATADNAPALDPSTTGSTTAGQESLAPNAANDPAPGGASNDNSDYKVPPPKEEPTSEVKEDGKKPTPQFDCGCT